LRMLTNLETDQHKLMQIIMIGQPELLDKLAQPELRQLEQRITARYHLRALTMIETAAYVHHRLKIAGMGDKPIFTEKSLIRVFKLSGGIPRRINLLCDRALLGAYVKSSYTVDPPLLDRASIEVFGERRGGRFNFNKKLVAWAAAIIVVVSGGVGLSAAYYKNSNTDEIYQSRIEDPLGRRVQQSDGASAQLSSRETRRSSHRTLTGTLSMDQQPAAISKEFAYNALFAAWDIGYYVDMGKDYCEVAERFDLMCYKNRGTLKDIKSLNRPAVLQVKTLTGKLFYLTVVGISGNTIQVMLDGKINTFTTKELDVLWRRGEFIVLWRAPPGYSGAISPGKSGPDVLWLSNQVSVIVGRDLSSNTNLKYKGALVEDIKAFQAAQGLVDDGIAGSKTLIHLNSEVFDDVPLLMRDS
ncbi:MAG: peptidoglycan-binding protein, partial [Thiohalomonadales bacterium]